MAPDRAREIAAAVGEALAAGEGIELDARATGGLSQETWFGRLTNGSGSGQEIVLRLPTRASGAQTIRAQRTALEAVAGSIPAPAIIRHRDDGDPDALGGGPWLIMERSRGKVPVGWHEIPEGSGKDALAADAIDVLAALHAIEPPDALRPRSRGDGAPAEISPAADLAVLQRRLARLEPLPVVLRAALRWLAAGVPDPLSRPVLVHGDYRMGNLVVRDDAVVAVLDWELATVGDPMSDLAWCFIPIWELAGVDEAPLIARYEDRRGVPVDLERLHWYRVFSFARLAYFALSGVRAFASGESADLRLAALALEVPVRLDRLMRTIRVEDIR